MKFREGNYVISPSILLSLYSLYEMNGGHKSLPLTCRYWYVMNITKFNVKVISSTSKRGSVGIIVHLGQFERNADNAGDHGLLSCKVWYLINGFFFCRLKTLPKSREWKRNNYDKFRSDEEWKKMQKMLKRDMYKLLLTTGYYGQKRLVLCDRLIHFMSNFRTVLRHQEKNQYLNLGVGNDHFEVVLRFSATCMFYQLPICYINNWQLGNFYHLQLMKIEYGIHIVMYIFISV